MSDASTGAGSRGQGTVHSLTHPPSSAERIPIGSAYTVTATVLDKETGKPIEGARCAVLGPDGRTVAEVTTKADGLVKVGVPAPGAYTVRVFEVPKLPPPPQAPDPKIVDLGKVKAKIIEVVATDATCKERIDSWLATALPDGLGVAGSIRNLWYIATFRDPTAPEIAAKVCTGIADATANAIEKGKVDGVKRVTVISRVRCAVHHTATHVILTDGREVVFDWHATLNSRNPCIMPKEAWLPT